MVLTTPFSKISLKNPFFYLFPDFFTLLFLHFYLENRSTLCHYYQLLWPNKTTVNTSTR